MLSGCFRRSELESRKLLRESPYRLASLLTVPHQIDLSLPFVPEALTTLAHTEVYQQLSEAERLSYNQCYGLYLNEQTAWFELTLTEFLVAVADFEPARELRASLLQVVLEEQGHAAAFWSLNRRVRPDLYRNTRHVFVKPSPWRDRVVRQMLRMPSVFPFPLWLIMLLEERSLYYSRLGSQQGHGLEPHFVRLNELHAHDEGRHVGLDEHLLGLLWDRLPNPLRRLNAFLLIQVFREFLFYPKRAAVQVLQVCFAGHPLLPLMQQQVLSLRYNRAFLNTLYHQERNPQTLALMERYPELEPMRRLMAA